MKIKPSWKCFPHVRKIHTLTNNRENIKISKIIIKKIIRHVLFGFYPVPGENADLSHVTHKLYHIMSCRVIEYTSIPRRERDSNYKFSVDSNSSHM